MMYRKSPRDILLPRVKNMITAQNNWLYDILYMCELRCQRRSKHHHVIIATVKREVKTNSGDKHEVNVNPGIN